MPQPWRVIGLFLALGAPLCLAAEPADAGGSFPLPSVDGKPLALVPGQKTFRVPMSFGRVEHFYREQFAREKGVSVLPAGTDGERTLTLTSRRKGETWTRAVVRQGQVDTSIEVTFVMRMTDESIKGSGKPLVQFVLTRSPEAAKAAAEIEHLQHP
ncbi:MAG: hypothetical protein ACYC8T_06930 [Myxococcaceae bacterium]